MIDTFRASLYIGGQWCASTGDSSASVVDATSEEEIGRVPNGTAGDVISAVSSAKRALRQWGDTPVEQRAEFLRNISAGIDNRSEELAALISREVGMPLRHSLRIQVGQPVETFSAQAQLILEQELETEIANSLVVREPVGVVGAITPWNYPLHQLACKVAPALAAGCTVVLKPSNVAPLTAFAFADIVDEIGLPPGVFNLVSGRGVDVGEALVTHADVGMISFTGSTETGRRVASLAAMSTKRTTLELGGKSPFVILPGADVAAAASRGVKAAFLNSGQTCSALTRMLAPVSMLAEIEAAVLAVVRDLRVGSPFAKGTFIGPLASAQQRDRVCYYISVGLEEGARLIAGGTEPVEGWRTGFFVRPTVFSDVTTEMRIAQEEIFGPVLVIQPYDDLDPHYLEEVAGLANSTPFGLSAGVFGPDRQLAMQLARRIQAGQVEVNGGAFTLAAPFGGYKQSGVGRENGVFGLSEYLETKAILR